FRDITEIKQREEALVAARADAERVREVMQTVLDNMSDGVMLFDNNSRLQFIDRRLVEFQKYPSDVIGPGTSNQDILRFQAGRGDFGPADDIERIVAERTALLRRPDGCRYERRAASGRYIE